MPTIPPPRGHLPPWRTYLAVLVPPLVVVTLVATLAIAAVKILDAIRAYEVSTSQTELAQARAVNAILRYAFSRDAQDWAQYRHAMRLPESAHHTRNLLRDFGPGKLEEVRRVMIEGGRHPDDVAAMLRLYQWFGPRFISSTTREGWRRTDQLMLELDREALQLHQAILQGREAGQLTPILRRINELEGPWGETARRLSSSWGRAARTTSTVLSFGILAVTVFLILVSSVQVRRGLLQQDQHTRSLAAIQRRWELASSTAGLGLYQLDPTHDTIQFDAVAAALHGLPAAPVTVARHQVNALIVPDDASRTQQEVNQALRSGQDYRVTYRIRLSDGSLRVVEATGHPVSSAPGEAQPTAFGVMRDITDAVNQAELVHQRETAEKVALAQREFLSRLSHELRTPLNAILGFAQLLSLDSARTFSTAQGQHVQLILSAGRQLLALIEDVLDLTKVEAGAISMHLEPVDLATLVPECVTLTESASQQYGVSIIDHSGLAAPQVMADSQRLRQVLINLLSNACKYNRPGGEVRIEVEADGDDVLLSVSDKGIGMSPQDAAGLFQPFKRAPSAMTHAQGTGLGLYIAKQLVELMQGELSVSTQLGEGSRFTVRLPRA